MVASETASKRRSVLVSMVAWSASDPERTHPRNQSAFSNAISPNRDSEMAPDEYQRRQTSAREREDDEEDNRGQPHHERPVVESDGRG